MSQPPASQLWPQWRDAAKFESEDFYFCHPNGSRVNGSQASEGSHPNDGLDGHSQASERSQPNDGLDGHWNRPSPNKGVGRVAEEDSGELHRLSPTKGAPDGGSSYMA